MKIRKSPDGRWFYDFTFDGKRFRIVTGLTREETTEAMHEHYRRLKRESLGLDEKRPCGTELFEDFGREFVSLYSKQTGRPKTVQSHENSIKHFNKAFHGKALSEITTEMIDLYKRARRAEVSPASVNREISCIKKMFSQAIRWGKLQANPAGLVVKFKENNCRMRILSNEEIARLLRAASDHIKPILIVALNTGMRKGEILGLRWENVNYPLRFITVQAAEAKSGRTRRVPMNAAVIDTLRAIPKENSFVFFNAKTRLGLQSIRTGFLGACRRAKKNPKDKKDPGIVGLRLHDLRHTAATKMIEAGVDIVTVSKILGHSSIEITYSRYCHPTPENMQAAVDRLGGLYAKAQISGKNLDTETTTEADSMAVNDSISA